jgi:hypothetical protein
MEALPQDPQEAFRIGLTEAPTARGAGLAEAAASWAGGPNEAVLLETVRLSGLSDAAAAYETGRVLRRVARLLDAVQAPSSVGRQFRDNVAAALVAHRSRQRPEAWDGAATADMFMEMYGRIIGFDDAVFARLRAALLEPGEASASRPTPFVEPFRRDGWPG